MRRSATDACTAILPLAAGLLLPANAATQQFVTDDAALAGFRACQLEAWHRQAASWILPACQLLPNLELTLGVGFVDAGPGEGRRTEYVLQGARLFRELTPNGPGVGLVAGVGYDPGSQVAGVDEVFAYVPLSLTLGDDRVIAHANLGWHLERGAHEHDGHVHVDAHHALTWAARADLLLPFARKRFTLIGEIFGEDRLRPGYQLGVRSTLVSERLLIDVSRGGDAALSIGRAWWAVGLAWTPPSFF